VGGSCWVHLPPGYIGDGSDDNLIQRYVIDDELMGMVVECIHPTSVGIMHPIGGKCYIHFLVCPSCIILVHDLYIEFIVYYYMEL
jgi:hypothetical protein